MKGIVLAGGSGSRLHPITKGVSKQLLPIYNKPMIYYPISILLNAGIKDILIISTPYDLPLFRKLLGTGEKIGVNFEYIEQPKPEGIAQAFILGKNFIGEDSVCLVLGENIFYGSGLNNLLKIAKNSADKDNNASIFGYYVNNPTRYGVAEFDDNNNVISIEEKPSNPKSNYAVVGLYFYPNSVIDISNKIIPSDRGELEITSVNNYYLKNKKLKLQLMKDGFTWLDTGTFDSLIQAGEFIKTIEKRTGNKISCLEEISVSNGYISENDAYKAGIELKNSEYGKYLINKFK